MRRTGEGDCQRCPPIINGDFRRHNGRGDERGCCLLAEDEDDGDEFLCAGAGDNRPLRDSGEYTRWGDGECLRNMASGAGGGGDEDFKRRAGTGDGDRFRYELR